MRALTLTQPWCGLVASGIKLVENRPRPMIKKEDFGKPFGLHASRVFDDSVLWKVRDAAPDLLADKCPWTHDGREPEIGDLRCARPVTFRCDNAPPTCRVHKSSCCVPIAEWVRLSEITSAVIAVATIRDAIYIGGCNQEAILRALERLGIPKQLRWTFGPTVYVLKEPPIVLPQPVPCRGYQGFWTLNGEVAARVEAQL